MIDFRTREKLKHDLNFMSRDSFWSLQLESFPNLARRVLYNLFPLATTYLCESGFSTLVNIKTKNTNELYVEQDLRCDLSKASPTFEEIISNKNEQCTH